MSLAKLGAAIHWEQVHERLRASEAALSDVLSTRPARMEAVFRRRAEILRSQRARMTPAASGIPALVFRVGSEKYAIELSQLAEVLPYRGCTHVPGASPELLGVVNLRGELRPVVDLAHAVSGSRSGEAGFVLMLGRKVGLKVDEMESLGEIRMDQMEPSRQGRLVRGVLPSQVLLLDVDVAVAALISREEFSSR